MYSLKIIFCFYIHNIYCLFHWLRIKWSWSRFALLDKEKKTLRNTFWKQMGFIMLGILWTSPIAKEAKIKRLSMQFLSLFYIDLDVNEKMYRILFLLQFEEKGTKISYHPFRFKNVKCKVIMREFCIDASYCHLYKYMSCSTF